MGCPFGKLEKGLPEFYNSDAMFGKVVPGYRGHTRRKGTGALRRTCVRAGQLLQIGGLRNLFSITSAKTHDW